MDKLKLIRENADLFKKHVQDMENLENQKIEQNKNEQIFQLNEKNKSQSEAEKYLKSLAQKASNENINNNNKNNNLHENLNNFVFNQIYDDSEDDYEKDDNVLQYNNNVENVENKKEELIKDTNN